jgi:hypothetical protein
MQHRTPQQQVTTGTVQMRPLLLQPVWHLAAVELTTAQVMPTLAVMLLVRRALLWLLLLL